MIEGHDAVLLDLHGDYSFLDVGFTRLRTTLIWIHAIVDVSTVVYELDGRTRILQLEHGPGDNQLRGLLDGTELSENNARRLFVSAMLINPSGTTDSQIPPDDPPEYSVTIIKTDDESDTLELYRLNDTQFLIVHNGENTGMFITRLLLQQNLLSKFDTVDSGGELRS